MEYPFNFDLHIHTSVSDGTDTPEELLEKVRSLSMKVFSITDHDASKGCRSIAKNLSSNDPRFITGAEFSCRDSKGKYHILAYGYGLESESIKRLIETGHSYREKKLERRLELLKSKYAITFPDDEIEALRALDNPGKPHLGNLLAKYGFAQSKDEAIDKFVNTIHTQSEYVSPEYAIDAIIAAGGIPVLAHPTFGSGREFIVGDEMKHRLERLISFGLKGVEAFYSKFTPELNKELLSFATDFNLYVTAGSDYHGKNKDIPLGETNMQSIKTLPEGMKRFFAEVNFFNVRCME